jgi:hypothetical protein
MGHAATLLGEFVAQASQLFSRSSSATRAASHS